MSRHSLYPQCIHPSIDRSFVVVQLNATATAAAVDHHKYGVRHPHSLVICKWIAPRSARRCVATRILLIVIIGIDWTSPDDRSLVGWYRGIFVILISPSINYSHLLRNVFDRFWAAAATVFFWSTWLMDPNEAVSQDARILFSYMWTSHDDGLGSSLSPCL